MTMIKCKECGKEISDKAKQCPHCGAPVKTGVLKGLMLAIAGGFLLLLVISMFLPSYDAAVIEANGTNGVSQDQSGKNERIYSRDEFKMLVMDKVPESLLDVVGQPDSTSTSGDTQYWYYRERTIDPVTGKVDHTAQVVIGKFNLVEEVNF